MTALLFIPTTAGDPDVRRIDFARIARRFAEPEAPQTTGRAASRIRQIAMAALVSLGVVGDMMLVAHADPAADCRAATPRAQSI